jgi:CubicO group peptidase (beta-lactamase class C family)
VTVHDLLTHQSGVIYGDPLGNALELAYDKLNIRGGAHALSTQKVVQALAKLPLAFQPGERWEYGYSTDILGYLVEVLSGMPLSQFFQSQILDPLNMVNTGFKQRENASVRLASSYGSTQNGLELLANAQDPNYGANVTFESGGAGLLSTLQDYQKLANLFLGRGEVEGIRLLGRKTFDFFVQNQLDGDLASHGQSHFSETTFEGVGFGLGMMVMIDPVRAKLLASKGEFGWGGMASTAFWIDPVENYSVILMTQLIPSSTYTLRRDLRVLTQQALI